jgi:hypothetical protein
LRASPFAVLAAAALAVGCAPRERDVRLERVAAETRNLEITFDRLEDRLLANQARVRFWREMRERHESITAIACVSQGEHAEEMALRALPPGRSSLHRARVAAIGGPAEPAPARSTRR